MRKEILIVFTRYPQPGSTKTRLIPALGEAQAADLQKKMAEHTFAQCCELAARRKLDTAVHYEGGDARTLRSWVPAAMSCQPQKGGSLGERLEQSFAAGFIPGRKRVIIVGSDCPFLTADILAAGFDLLHDHDLVLGPAHDGGYYLIGLRQPNQFLWTHIDWGTGRVMQQTLEIARQKGLRPALLPSLTDIDRPEDLHSLVESAIGCHFFAGRT